MVDISNVVTGTYTPPATGPAEVPETVGTLYAWWDASDASTISTTGTSVTEWRSRVGSVTLNQATGALQPTYPSATAINGISVIESDGTNSLTSTVPGYPAAATVILVHRTSTAGNANSSVLTFGDDPPLNRWRISRGGFNWKDDIVSSQHPNLRPGGNYADIRHMVSYEHGDTIGDAAVVRVNGAEASDADTLTALYDVANSQLVLMSTLDESAGSESLVCELLIYDGILSAADMNTLGAYLGPKWAFTYTDR